MLQALGSNTKTNISYVMFGGCCFLIVGAFFVARMERIEFDETYAYCATVYYSPKTGYRVEYWGQRNDFERISTGCARACYKDQKHSNGLAFIEIETQSGYNDHHQAFCAGILEGSLTWMNIYAQWTNTIESFCRKSNENQKFCIWLRDIVNTNYQNVLTLAKDNHKTDNYHHQIFLFYQQLIGIETGFKKGVERARREFEIPFVDFILLNSRIDIQDLKIYYNEFVANDEKNEVEIMPRVGQMILKVLSNDMGQPKILVGHSADGDYNSMLKIVKTYRFKFHQGPDASSRLVANTDITFSSYPGAITSSDDFYLASGKHSRIIISGVSLKHHESSQLLHGLDLEGTVFLAARVMAANRLSHNGKFWSKVMARDPDIGAKQWLIIDEKRLKFLTDNSSKDDDNEMPSTINNNDIPSDQPSSPTLSSNRNIIWLIDQTWQRLHAEDVTKIFINDSFGWKLDGTPFFKVIQELNGLMAKDNKFNSNLESVDDVAKVLKEKAHRGDLKAFGNIDMKIYSSANEELLVQTGPLTSQDVQPFNWNANNLNNYRHDEHPILWNFPSVQVQFLWN
ncbi:CLUMA_CG012945, isoform A [Clunio marinus]|uniref:Phospholipase B-like n=1 Tax=Clunio marinus TaxID=568069 RepID=A0A1J1IIN7_9DIPT|nr:CLUMA_CG012945, isoform A [Clunio marinus]